MTDGWELLSSGPEMTRGLGALFGEWSSPGSALFLSGDLGAGKTCFSQGVAGGLGVPADVPVTSPSYTLLNLYDGRLKLYHFDLYRLGHVDELEEIGFDDCLSGGGVTLVEWLDRFPELQPQGIFLHLAYGKDANERHLRFAAKGHSAVVWLGLVRDHWQHPHS